MNQKNNLNRSRNEQSMTNRKSVNVITITENNPENINQEITNLASVNKIVEDQKLEIISFLTEVEPIVWDCMYLNQQKNYLNTLRSRILDIPVQVLIDTGASCSVL